jgi:hypothetical protein
VKEAVIRKTIRIRVPRAAKKKRRRKTIVREESAKTATGMIARMRTATLTGMRMIARMMTEEVDAVVVQ